MAKLPWIKFFPNDWLAEPSVRACSLAARGLWMDMLSMMHLSPRRGYLLAATGLPLTPEQLARMTGCSAEEVVALLGELRTSGCFSCTDDGIVFSRRMVREESKRERCSVAGKKGGGNPALKQKGGSNWFSQKGYVYAMTREQDAALKIGASVDPHRRQTQGGAGTIPHYNAKVARSWPVSQMGAAESLLHKHFAAKQESGEWYWLNTADLDSIEAILTAAGLTYIGVPKGGAKGDPKGDPKALEARSQMLEPPTPCGVGEGVRVLIEDPPEEQTLGPSVAEVVGHWNSHERLPRAADRMGTRDRVIGTWATQNAAWAQHWRLVIDWLAGSEFHCGGGPNRWRADLNWLLLKAENFEGVLAKALADRPAAPKPFVPRIHKPPATLNAGLAPTMAELRAQTEAERRKAKGDAA